jgi:endonuclease G, mitochondrial
MSAPDNLLAFDLDVARRAARHWDSAAAARKRKLEALRHGRLDEVEPMDRLAKRVNHLVDKVRDVPFSERENLPETLKQLVNKNRIEEDEIDSPLVERVIGETRDFLSVEFIAQAQNAIRSVGRVVTRIGNGRVSYGTGFMVSPRLLMTNHHVLPSAEVAARSRIEFDFQRDLSGRGLAVQPFDLDPAAFFLADRDLDFALVAVNPRPSGARPLEWFGHQPLIGSEGKIMIGEPINIVQHPKGEMKQIVIRENRLLDLPEEPDTVAHYEADTEPGSSGSPVFSDAWEIIALHHSGVPRTNGRGQILDVDGRVWARRRRPDPDRLGRQRGHPGVAPRPLHRRSQARRAATGAAGRPARRQASATED